MSAPPAATYRLQLTPEFGFAEAGELLDYLRELGVSHVYLSPIFEAAPGSEHGYDITDPTRLREALGGEAAFLRFAEETAGRGLRIILDIVPNHMATVAENRWWWDVLKHGPDASGAPLFDIDWEAGGGRVLLPVLGRPAAELIAAGELKLDHGSPHDPQEPVLRYHEHLFPASGADGGDDLETLLERQAYRLLPWQAVRRGRLNYRRFFDITDLVGVRVENEEVFETTHALIGRLVAEGRVAGLRVDHVDGLREPGGYLRRLRALRPELILVEKILAGDEALPRSWPVEGTTGYEFLARVNRLFVHPAGLAHLDAHARRVAGPDDDFENVARECKREVFRTSLRPALRRLTGLLDRVAAAEAVRGPRDFETAIIETAAALPVYRTYLDGTADGDEDRRRVDASLAAAGAAGADPAALEVLRRAMLDRGALAPAARAAAGEFAARFQQMTGAVMAKGVEDTALYRCVALSSLNEVGCEPVLPEDPVADFHRLNAARAAAWPAALNATATHDTKRGEDTRLRISVLSEFAGQWTDAVDRWRGRHEPLRAACGAPRPADELLFYQSLLGVWPAGEAADLAPIAERLTDYLTKAAREAEVATSWSEPDEAYEAGLGDFVEAVLLRREGRRFRDDVEPWRQRTAFFGGLSSLAQIVLKTAAPGAPDFYRGTELWDLTLVDPDNRRPVPFERCRAALQGLAGAVDGPPADVLAGWPDGRVKLWTTARALALRRAQRPLWQRGGYLPVAARGAHAGRVVALARSDGDAWAVVIAARLLAGFVELDGRPGDAPWDDTAVELPPGAPRRWVEWFTGRSVAVSGSALAVGDALTALPAAVLVNFGPRRA